MKVRRILSTILSICLLLGLTFVPIQKVHADVSNQAVLDARTGILEVMVGAKTPNGSIVNLYVGTGFLVGPDDGAQTVITNHHVVRPMDYAEPGTEEALKETLGLGENDDLELVVRVVVKRDVYINASIVNESMEMDFAILKLEQPIYDRQPLTLADTKEVQTTENVYALGFPMIVQEIQDDQVYTSDDVTVTSGTVSKTSDVVLANSPIPCITHSAVITGGNSGGALLDEDGNVIGVNRFASEKIEVNVVDMGGIQVLGVDTENDYYYSVKISEVADVLRALGIEYKSADSTGTTGGATGEDSGEAAVVDGSEGTAAVTEETVTPTPEITPSPLLNNLQSAIEAAGNTDLENMTQESVDIFNEALDNAKNTYNNTAATDEELQDAIDQLQEAQNGLVPESGMNVALIVGIVIAVVAVIAVIIIIVAVSSSKKKKAAAEKARQRNLPPRQTPPAGGFQQPPVRPVQGTGAQGGFTGSPNFRPQPPMDDGAAETGVLNDGSNATTVLSGQNIPVAYLIRKKNGERVTISKAVFKIGKERRKVDYCVADNTNVSRIHADIVYKDGGFYILDNHSTNGTTVNGGSIGAGQERKLSNNDIVKLADEEFQFRMF